MYEYEPCSVGVGGVEADATAKEGGKLSADGETEAGALLEYIEFLEPLEDEFCLIWGHTNAGVGD